MSWLLSLVAASLLLVGCQSVPEGRTYDLRGQVLAVRPEIREVSLAHEEIPGYMPAMSMSFGVKDVTLIQGLSRGDLIRATLIVTDSDAWLTTVQKTGHEDVKPDAEAEPSAAAPAAADPELLEPGQAVPDDALVDQDGERFSLADARGRAVALTFIYTRCPLPTFCPLMDRHFAAAQRLIEGRPDLRDRTLLVTVSFDPAFDTPAVLRAHATGLGAKTDHWRFLTGEIATVDRFATAFGVSVVRDTDDAANIVHNLRTAVIGPDGRLRKILSGGDWTPEQLVGELSSAVR